MRTLSAPVELSGHHSDPPAPLEGLLNDASSRSGAGREPGRTCATQAAGGALGAAHPRQGRIIDAISRVLIDEREPMQSRDVQARVEALLGEPVRWFSVKATLAGNLKRPGPQIRPGRPRTLQRPRPCIADTRATRHARDARFAD